MKAGLALLAAVALAGCATDRLSSDHNPLVGAWQLVRYVDTPDQGEPVHAYGDPPGGLFVFTDDGHASIVVMRNPPEPGKTNVDPDPDACIPTWYCSYYGTYRYDPVGPSWTVHVEGGNVLSYVGTDQFRRFRIARRPSSRSKAATPPKARSGTSSAC